MPRLILCRSSVSFLVSPNTLQKQTKRSLTQKYSTLNPGILLWLAPTWCIQPKKLSRSSRPLIPSSKVFITLLACSASSMELICSSFVRHWRNFSNMFSRSWFSSNNLGKKRGSSKLGSECRRVVSNLDGRGVVSGQEALWNVFILIFFAYGVYFEMMDHSLLKNTYLCINTLLICKNKIKLIFTNKWFISSAKSK